MDILPYTQPHTHTHMRLDNILYYNNNRFECVCIVHCASCVKLLNEHDLRGFFLVHNGAHFMNWDALFIVCATGSHVAQVECAVVALSVPHPLLLPCSYTAGWLSHFSTVTMHTKHIYKLCTGTHILSNSPVMCAENVVCVCMCVCACDTR